MYAKVFTQIFDSTLANNWQFRHVFEDMLKLCDQGGICDMTHEAISARTRVPLKLVRQAITYLEGPDLKSRSKVENGARIKRLSEDRDWGWWIINYELYREMKTQSDRTGHARNRGGDDRLGYVYYAQNNDQVKIAFTANPWARIKQLKVELPNIKLVATTRTTASALRGIHQQFCSYHVEKDFYQFTEEIRKFITTMATKVALQKSCSNYPPSASCTTSPSLSSSSGGTGGATNGHSFSVDETITHVQASCFRLFNRPPSQRLSYKAEHALAEICRRPDVLAELAELELLKRKKDSFFPQSLEALLEQWDKTVDRARNFIAPSKTNQSNYESRIGEDPVNHAVEDF